MLQLVFPKDDLFAVVVEGLSPNEQLKLGREAEDIADLTLFYGEGDTFETCTSQQILQFKYKVAAEPVTSSYLKKTIKKFAATLRSFREHVSLDDIAAKLSFGFVTNAEFSSDLWDAIACLRSGKTPTTGSAKNQLKYLKDWCKEEKVEASEIFPLVEFRAATSDLPSQNRALRRTVSDWSAGSTGQAAKRLFALVELVREKSQMEGQNNNSIRREDVLDALECDEDQLFPADTRFVDVGDIVKRTALQEVRDKIETSELPVFLCADGGVGKTVFIESLAAHIKDSFEVVVFDCFGGGAYRSEGQARHLPRVGLLQIINELAIRGLCDPLLPTDSDQYGMIEVARKRLKQASETVRNQSSLQGVLVVIDAADNAQLEANARNEVAFPRSLLSSLSAEPIEGVKLLLTARPHRVEGVIGNSRAQRVDLEPFSEEETRAFLGSRRENVTDLEFSTAFARSQGNARVLSYLVESWDTNVSGNAPLTQISAEELIAQRCEKIFADLHTAGWSDAEVRALFAALSLLPPPIPLPELAEALGWPCSQVNSAAADLAPMLELVKHGAIFRDEPTETYIRDHYADATETQQSIAQRLQTRQKESIYAAEALPHFLVVIGDSDRAYQLAGSDEFPDVLESEHERRRLRLARLHAAFSLATRGKDLDRVLSLTMKLSQMASANAKGDQFIRRSPSLATILGGVEASRRLFNDRSGWRGARDARLTIAYSFADELDEARIHQNRAIGWINWHIDTDDETKRFEREGFAAADIAAVMFLSVLKNEFFSFNRNIQPWRFEFALSVIQELIELCAQHESSNGSDALCNLVNFAKSKRCLSLTLQIGLLTNECGLLESQLKAISRAASSLAERRKTKISLEKHSYELNAQSAVAGAAMSSLIVNSAQSAKRLLKLCHHRRPTGYDYGERFGVNRVWASVRSACVLAWSSGEALSFRHLLPADVKPGRKAKSIATESDLREFLDGLIVTTEPTSNGGGHGSTTRKQFSQQERDDIVKGAACVLHLVKPIETVLLSKAALSNDVLSDFLLVWKSTLRPNIHWRSQTGRDGVARHVGIGLAKILLRHSVTVEKTAAEELIKIADENQLSLGDKLRLLALFARRANLADVTGAYATTLSHDILKDDYVANRGDSYRDLAGSLVPMSINEAREYYTQGLAQLDQMGSDDYDLIYQALHYAAKQPGGLVKPELSHRLMNLCQTILQDEPSKFGWTLFGRAAASSIGFPALYKLIRWDDQDVADYSYGVPQLACFLAKAGHLDPRRAAILLTLCEDHGWHEWQISEGLNDLLSVADSSVRKPIFSLAVGKLDREHSFGGWPRVWEGLLGCVDTFAEIDEPDLRNHLLELQKEAKHRRDIENARSSYGGVEENPNLQGDGTAQDEQTSEDVFTAILSKCDPTSASSLDEAIQQIDAEDRLRFKNRNRLFDEIRKGCEFNERAKFLGALCESNELEFDRALDLLIECIEEWADSTAHVKNGVLDLIKKLFSFKGSELFDLRYSGMSRQLHRLSKLCGDAEFVLKVALETIAKERLELGGDEWLEVATSLSCHTKPSAALEAFEDFLSSSATNVGDEIGEGAYRGDFACKSDDRDILADVIWHLLGDDDAFVRWSAARSLEGMLELDLIEDVERLLDRFDTEKNEALVSEGHHFAFQNAQQWLLMGLSRAALRHGDRLKTLKSRIEALAKRTDIHVLNKLHLARCLDHIEGNKAMSAGLASLWEEVRTPVHGIVERKGQPKTEERQIAFNFDYDFDKYQISELARLFWISDNDARDRVASEVIKRWPGSSDINDFPGGVRYRPDERFETYAEHVQRHARLHAATTLANTLPVVRSSYDWKGANPWKAFIQREDVSFADGSWLSDHKDRVPAQAREHLLGERKGNQERLIGKEALFQCVGVPESAQDQFLPLYGYWKSPDGVYVSFVSALVIERGAVGKCNSLSKTSAHDFWLPRYGSDGRVDRYTTKGPFDPLIWVPETYPIGIDERDEWAARGAIARPKLGLAINRLLGLTTRDGERHWHDRKGKLALKSSVWGEWRPDADTRGGRYQDEGAILWADLDWLEETLKSCKRGLIFKFDFSKYKSSRSYDESSGVREQYVGLKRKGELPRFWFAKKASETMY